MTRKQYLVVVDNPVWKGLLLFATPVRGTAGVCGRVVASSSVHICQSRGNARVLHSHLWCLVGIAFDISQRLLLVEGMVVQ